MAIVGCRNGHYYDNAESDSCPYCTGRMIMGESIPLNSNAVPVTGVTMSPTGAFGRAEPIRTQPVNVPGGATIPPTTYLGRTSENVSVKTEALRSEPANISGGAAIPPTTYLGRTPESVPEKIEVLRSEPANIPGGAAIPPTTYLGNTPERGFGKTELLRDKPVNAPGASTIPPTTFIRSEEPEHTDVSKISGIKPVKGWLVVTKGAAVGMDYRICTGQNFIGRLKSNDIAVDFDNTISAERACVILYDERTNEFDILRGEGANLVYLNGERLLDPKPLKDNDFIEIGQTQFVFRSLCNESFNY